MIGVNVAYVPPQAGAVAIGFAIPSRTVQEVVTQLLETGRVERGFLGVGVATITPQIAQRFRLPVDQGVLVIEVVSGSPAAEDLSRGDILLALDDEPLTEAADLYRLLRVSRPGQTITLTVLSDGEEQEVQVTLGEAPGAP